MHHDGCSMGLVMLAFGFGVLAWPGSAADHQLASRGQARMAVALLPNASPAEAFAAQELAGYLTAVTGAPFSVGPVDAGAPTLIAAATERLAAAGIALDIQPLPRDAYHILSVGDDVVIAGHSSCSALFGAYHFLERYVGCRWYMPGELGEVLPQRPDLSVPRLNERRVPAFEYRIASGFSVPEYIDWAAKHGLQVWSPTPSWWTTGAQGERELCVRGTIHHAFDKVAPATVYADAHPEYFGLLGGERLTAVDKQQRGQLCVTSPELMFVVVAAARAYFDRHPDAEFFSLCPNDNQSWCECRQCEACDSYTMVRWERTWPVVSDRYFAFVRRVAERLALTHPGKKLYCFSYQTYTDPPRRVQLPSNVIVGLCHMVPACYAHPVTDPACEQNAAFDKLLTGWARSHDNLWYYAYTCKSMWQQMPWPIFRRLAKDIQHLRDQGFRGIYSQGTSRCWGQLGINFYVMAKALWDPDVDVDAVLDDYYTGFYADASEPMRRFHETLAAGFGKPGVYVHHEAYEQAPAFMTPELVRDCDDALAAAERAAPTELVLKRIQPVATAWEFAKLYLSGYQAYERFSESRAESDISEAVQAYTRIMEIGQPPLNAEALRLGSLQHYVQPKLEAWRVELLLCSGSVEWQTVDLSDSSFERAGEGWSLGEPSETRTAALSEVAPKHGTHSLHLRVADAVDDLPPGDWVTMSACTDRLSVVVHNLYRLSAWVRVPKRFEYTQRGATMGLLGYDADGKQVSYNVAVAEIRQLDATDGWIRVHSGGVLTDPRIQSVRVRLGMAGRGECFFDDVRLETTRPPE